MHGLKCFIFKIFKVLSFGEDLGEVMIKTSHSNKKSEIAHLISEIILP